MIKSNYLADEARSVYTSGTEFACDSLVHDKSATINKGVDKTININVNPQVQSLKAIRLLFIEPYIFPDLNKVTIIISSKLNMIYHNGLESCHKWDEASSFFIKEKSKIQQMNVEKFYAEDKFGLLVDLHTLARQLVIEWDEKARTTWNAKFM